MSDFTISLHGNTWRAVAVSQAAYEFMWKILGKKDETESVSSNNDPEEPPYLQTQGSGILLRQLIEANGLTVEGEIPTI